MISYNPKDWFTYIFRIHKASLELIAEEIEDPFSRDANDLPTEKLSENIREAVSDII